MIKGEKEKQTEEGREMGERAWKEKEGRGGDKRQGGGGQECFLLRP